LETIDRQFRPPGRKAPAVRAENSDGLRGLGLAHGLLLALCAAGATDPLAKLKAPDSSSITRFGILAFS
jgi:hypothetical protein